MNMRILSLSSLLLVVGVMNGLVRPTAADLQELQEKLQQFESRCDEATKDDVENIVEFLRNHPDLKDKHSRVIAHIHSNASYKATGYKNLANAELNAINAQKHSECAQNCNFVSEEFFKLLYPSKEK